MPDHDPRTVQIFDHDTWDEPLRQTLSWLIEAEQKEPNDPNAMALSTVDADGLPNVRMVLLKNLDPQGFVFFTNHNSTKGQELLASSKAALCFHWKSLRRQIRARGLIEVVSTAESDAYFTSRPKDSQIGSWASRQSQPMSHAHELEVEVARYAAKYALRPVDRPPHWAGFRLKPLEIEFWRDRPFRLHERLVWRRGALSSPWRTERLFP